MNCGVPHLASLSLCSLKNGGFKQRGRDRSMSTRKYEGSEMIYVDWDNRLSCFSSPGFSFFFCKLNASKCE